MRPSPTRATDPCVPSTVVTSNASAESVGERTTYSRPSFAGTYPVELASAGVRLGMVQPIGQANGVALRPRVSSANSRRSGQAQTRTGCSRRAAAPLPRMSTIRWSVFTKRCSNRYKGRKDVGKT
jgi:hypothetical protein